jgi:hypothetical protein
LKQWIISGVFGPKTKKGDDEFKSLVAAVEQTAALSEAEASVKLNRDGSFVLSALEPAGEQILAKLKELPNVTISGMSSPMDEFIQRRINKKPKA